MSDAGSNYPAPLRELIEFFEHLPEPERRENLIHYADAAAACAPAAGREFELVDVRKDEECTDTVGVFLSAGPGDTAVFAVELGPKVQTLTKAMTAILCRGLNGVPLQEVRDVPADFVPRIIGAELVRLRSQTVYYVLSRMKTAVRMLLDRRRRGGV
jgi:cysteine desulfuration protein SufE